MLPVVSKQMTEDRSQKTDDYGYIGRWVQLVHRVRPALFKGAH